MAAPLVGLTLPSFVRDPDEVYAVATAAEAHGLDGVFCYDHLFRVARDGSRRPALESTALLGALAAITKRVRLCVLVTRASLRPAAVTAVNLATAQRISGGRVIGAIGAGDEESRAENEEFGVGFGTIAHRLAALRAAVRATRDQGFPVWVGGSHRDVRALTAAEADGWNRWGGDDATFAAHAGAVTAAAVRSPFTCSWGGLVVLDRDDPAARAKAERLGAGPATIVGGPATVAGAFARYVDAGAHWVIAGPVDSRDPANAGLVAEVKAHLAG